MQVVKNKNINSDVERVFIEIQCLTELTHENIVKLLECKDNPSNLMLILEYIGGGNLNE